MRYPTITKMLAVFLLICSLAVIVTGGYGISRAGKDRALENEKLEALLADAESYAALDKALSGEISYAQAGEELEELKLSHSDAAGEHRRELTEYSAEKGGLSMGSEALSEAEQAMLDWQLYCEQGLSELESWESAVAEMQEMLPLARAQYEAGLALYELAAGGLEGARLALDELYNLDEIMDSDDDYGRLEMSLQTYDRAIGALEGSINYLWELEAQGFITADQIENAENNLFLLTGMSSADILNLLYTTRDEIASGALDGISEEEFLYIKETYMQYRELIMQTAAVIEEKLLELDWELQLKGEELSAASEQLAQGEAMLEQALPALEEARAMLESAGLAMEQGETGLADARAEIDARLAQLEGQFDELSDEKARLSTEAEEIELLEQENEERRELETERSRLSIKLRENERIKALCDAGTELSQAAAVYGGEQRLNIERIYKSSIIASGLMLAGAAAGILSMPGIFRKKSAAGRARRLALPILCLILCGAAEAVARANGLDDISSAVTAAVMAGLVIAAGFANKKKKPASV